MGLFYFNDVLIRNQYDFFTYMTDQENGGGRTWIHIQGTGLILAKPGVEEVDGR